MPVLRGIKVNIVSQESLQIHPEFLQPGVTQDSSPRRDFIVPTTNPDIDEVFESKLDSRSLVSVYVPSIPKARFWIHWTITDLAVDLSRLYYFKLSMNGRHIASWGTDPSIMPSGQVMRGLFEPSDRWNYKSNGILYKNMGTEARPFIFAEADTATPAASDGGMIEVKVYRAMGRRRKLPEPTDFRDQEPYGIIMPSAGLLDRPQDARFYDWYLQDPVDAAFATFKFHYRSWDSLQALALIGEDDHRALLSPTNSLLSLLGQDERELLEPNDNDEEHNVCEEETIYQQSDWKSRADVAISADDSIRDSVTSDGSATPWLTTVFDNSPQIVAELGRKSFAGLQYDLTPTSADPRKVDLISKFSATAMGIKKVSEVSLSFGNDKLNTASRPLPEVPRRKSWRASGHSRGSSTTSGAPSITPSLWSYIDRGDNSSPEPLYNTAKPIVLPSPTHVGKAHLVDINVKGNDFMPTNHTITPLEVLESGSTLATTYKLMPIPPKPRAFTPPTRKSSAANQPQPLASSPLQNLLNRPQIASVAVRKHKRSHGNIFSRLSISGSPFKNTTSVRQNSFSKPKNPERPNQAQLSTFNRPMSESEWMCRTPSPRKEDLRISSENTYNPSPNTKVVQVHHHETESSFTTSGSPPLLPANHASTAMRKVERNGSTNRDRFLGWFDNVRSSKEEERSERSLATGSTMSDDMKVRNGWI